MAPLPASYEAAHAGFQHFVDAMHSEWYASVSVEQLQGLSSALLTQVHALAGKRNHTPLAEPYVYTCPAGKIWRHVVSSL